MLNLVFADVVSQRQIEAYERVVYSNDGYFKNIPFHGNSYYHEKMMSNRMSDGIVFLIILVFGIVAIASILSVLIKKVTKKELTRFERFFSKLTLIVLVMIFVLKIVFCFVNSIDLRIKLDNAKKELTASGYSELIEDIKSISINGISKYATIQTYDNGTNDKLHIMEGQGYQIKRDGTVSLIGSNNFSYKIKLPPEYVGFKFYLTSGYIW